MSASTLVAIDPGSAGRGSAWAAFDARGVLRAVGFATAGTAAVVIAQLGPSAAARIVVERPAYQGARSRGAHVGDLINLAWDGAALAYLLAGRLRGDVTERTPAQWKGSEPKPRQHARAWRLLTYAERDVLGGDATHLAIERATERGALDRWKKPGVTYYPRAFIAHNLLDAVALGLVTLGRYATKDASNARPNPNRTR